MDDWRVYESLIRSISDGHGPDDGGCRTTCLTYSLDSNSYESDYGPLIVALREMDVDLRDIYLRRIIDKQSIEEIAAFYCVSYGAAERRLDRAKEYLAERLGL